MVRDFEAEALNVWSDVDFCHTCISMGGVGLIDRFTTLTHTSLAWWFVIAWAVLVLLLCLRAYFTGDYTSDKVERLKRNNKFIWGAVGVVFSVVLSALSGFVFEKLIKTVAQHLSGESVLVSGQVTAVQLTSGRGACRFYATVIPGLNRESLRACVRTYASAAVGPIDLEPGQRVTLRLKDTALGVVLLEIERDR